jgi:PAS domain S-box-containing protein
MTDPNPGRDRILIVAPDQPDVRELLALLTGAGYGVSTVAGSQSALEAARVARPELILLDMGLSDADISGLSRGLKSVCAPDEVPLLLIAAPSRSSPAGTLAAAGAADHLSRPLEPGEVLARIATQMQLQTLRRQLAEKQAELQRREACHDEGVAYLEQSEARYRQLVENVSEVIYSADKNGVLTYVSPAVKSLLEYEAPEVVGRQMLRFMHPDDRQRMVQNLGRVLSGETVSNEYRLLTRSGATRWVRTSSRPALDDGRMTGVFGVVSDITQQREAEEARKKSERRYRQLLDALQEGIWVIDRDARTAFVNPRMAEMLGYAEEEMLGRHLFDFMDERGIEIARQNLERRADGVREQHDFELLTKDGRRVYTVMETSPITDEQGNYGGAVAGVLDITERRSVEQAAHEARAAAEKARNREAERRRETEWRREIAEGLQGVMAALNSNQPVHQVLAIIAEQARKSLADQTVAIYALRPADGTFLLQTAQGLQAKTVGPEPSLPGHQALSEAVATRRPVQCPAVTPAPQNTAAPPEDEGVYAGESFDVLAVPILVKDEVYGGMLFYGSESRTLSPEEIDLASAFCNQVALAVESARLREQAEQAAVNAERSRLARDLHDSVTQSLFSASLVAEVLATIWQKDPDEAIHSLEQLRRLTRGALAEMRAMLLELRPTALLESKLDDLLRQLAEAMAGRADVIVSPDAQPVPALPPDVQVTFYRIAQEALQNVAKHAEARHVALRLEASPPLEPEQATGDWRGQVQLQVSDDGRGFDPASVQANRLGLHIMRERAESIGAELTVETGPGRGTQITLAWQTG